jgi:type III restriction enzyme
LRYVLKLTDAPVSVLTNLWSDTSAPTDKVYAVFAVPYVHNGQSHDYMPDFIVRLRCAPPCLLILETKGFDPTEEVKTAAAGRWVSAVNADGTYGRWAYAVAKRGGDIDGILTRFAGP